MASHWPVGSFSEAEVVESAESYPAYDTMRYDSPATVTDLRWYCHKPGPLLIKQVSHDCGENSKGRDMHVSHFYLLDGRNKK